MKSNSLRLLIWCSCSMMLSQIGCNKERPSELHPKINIEFRLSERLSSARYPSEDPTQPSTPSKPLLPAVAETCSQSADIPQTASFAVGETSFFTTAATATNGDCDACYVFASGALELLANKTDTTAVEYLNIKEGEPIYIRGKNVGLGTIQVKDSNGAQRSEKLQLMVQPFRVHWMLETYEEQETEDASSSGSSVSTDSSSISSGESSNNEATKSAMSLITVRTSLPPSYRLSAEVFGEEKWSTLQGAAGVSRFLLPEPVSLSLNFVVASQGLPGVKVLCKGTRPQVDSREPPPQ